jgi:outer membrane usher protein FimD/PapC
MGRAEGIVAARQSHGSNGTSSLVEASLASALVISKGGGWGWSAPVYDSAAQFRPYKGYEGLKLLVDARSEISALTSDRFGTPPLSSLSAYVPRELQIDLEDLPPGMSLGEDRPVLLPSYRSVVVVPVGSRDRTQVSGRLMGANQQPLPLNGITLTGLNPSQTMDLFTNRKGLFLSPQLPPGVYELRLPGKVGALARFEVTEEQSGVLDIGALQTPADSP